VQISDEAVQSKTGKTWAEWFAILDATGAMKMNHKGIVAYLREQYRVGPWSQQMVTVAYEHEGGKRRKYETPTGFQASAGKTMAVPPAALYKAGQSETIRKRWLPDPAITIRRATPNKSLRITWSDGKTSVEVNSYPKGDGKSRVAVEHRKLATAKEVARMKSHWTKTLRVRRTLEALKTLLAMKVKDR